MRWIGGRLPADLNGVFYRNGPDPQYPPHSDDAYHPFDGDGMIYAFTLADGRASLRHRWVRTPKFLAERKAGKRLYGVFGNPRFNEPEADPATSRRTPARFWCSTRRASRTARWPRSSPPPASPPASTFTGAGRADRRAA